MIHYHRRKTDRHKRTKHCYDSDIVQCIEATASSIAYPSAKRTSLEGSSRHESKYHSWLRHAVAFWAPHDAGGRPKTAIDLEKLKMEKKKEEVVKFIKEYMVEGMRKEACTMDACTLRLRW